MYLTFYIRCTKFPASPLLPWELSASMKGSPTLPTNGTALTSPYVAITIGQIRKNEAAASCDVMGKKASSTLENA